METTVPLLKINLNDEVMVKLTPFGHSLFVKYQLQEFEKLEEAIEDDETKAKAQSSLWNEHIPDGEGYLHFQLYELMGIFGQELFLGQKTIFEDNAVVFGQ